MEISTQTENSNLNNIFSLSEMNDFSNPESYDSLIHVFGGKNENNIKNFLLQYDSIMETINLEA